MSIVLIGGIDRLVREYIDTANEFGFKLKVFTKVTKNFDEKIKFSDGIIVFTNMISHKAKIEATKVAKKRDIPIFFCHSCGICSLKNCLMCIKKIMKKNNEE